MSFFFFFSTYCVCARHGGRMLTQGNPRQLSKTQNRALPSFLWGPAVLSWAGGEQFSLSPTGLCALQGQPGRGQSLNGAGVGDPAPAQAGHPGHSASLWLSPTLGFRPLHPTPAAAIMVAPLLGGTVQNSAGHSANLASPPDPGPLQGAQSPN